MAGKKQKAKNAATDGEDLYFVTYETESSDRGVEGYFTSKPTDGQLTALFKKTMPDEFRDTRGEERRTVYWQVHRLKKQDLPKPVKAVPSI